MLKNWLGTILNSVDVMLNSRYSFTVYILVKEEDNEYKMSVDDKCNKEF